MILEPEAHHHRATSLVLGISLSLICLLRAIRLVMLRHLPLESSMIAMIDDPHPVIGTRHIHLRPAVEDPGVRLSRYPLTEVVKSLIDPRGEI